MLLIFYFTTFVVRSFLALVQMDKRYAPYIKLSFFRGFFILAIFAGLRASEVGDCFFELGFTLLITIISSFTDSHLVFTLLLKCTGH